MKNKLLIFVLIIPLLVLIKMAPVGNLSEQPNIFYLGETGVKAPKGDTYNLGVKTTTRHLIWGAWIRKDGLVLYRNDEKTADGGRWKEYIPLENFPVTRLQQAKLLPEKLPEARIPIGQYLFGYALWIILIYIGMLTALIFWPQIKEWRQSR